MEPKAEWIRDHEPAPQIEGTGLPPGIQSCSDILLHPGTNPLRPEVHPWSGKLVPAPVQVRIDSHITGILPLLAVSDQDFGLLEKSIDRTECGKVRQ